MAIKSIKDTGEEQLREVLMEVNTMQRLSHDNIVKLFGVTLPTRDSNQLKLVIFCFHLVISLVPVGVIKLNIINFISYIINFIWQSKPLQNFEFNWLVSKVSHI